jgi:hypothetical protein
MLFSALRCLPEYSSLKGKEKKLPPIPGIEELQVTIEDAWREGQFSLRCATSGELFG